MNVDLDKLEVKALRTALINGCKLPCFRTKGEEVGKKP